MGGVRVSSKRKLLVVVMTRGPVNNVQREEATPTSKEAWFMSRRSTLSLSNFSLKSRADRSCSGRGRVTKQDGSGVLLLLLVENLPTNITTLF